jgi:thiol-disulfide isomerase/thioredoxin
VPPNVVVLLVALAVATLVGVAWRRFNGHFRGAAGVDAEQAATARETLPERDVVPAQDLPGPLGQRATLLQFSSAFCAPCRATRRTLTEVAGMVPGVVHLELDAEHHLDLVRRLGVRRTPTTFVLDARGGIVTRAAGAPTKPAVVAALGRAVEAADPGPTARDRSRPAE